jgi:hypothetical protein
MLFRIPLAASLAVAGSLLLGLPASVRAESTLVTGALPLDATTVYRCVAVNIGKKAITGMSVSVINGSTTPPTSVTAVCPTVAPGKTCAGGSGDQGLGDVYCAITSPAPAKSIRGTMMAVLAGGAIGATTDAR